MCRRHNAGKDGIEGGREGGGREKGSGAQLYYDCGKKRVNST